MEKMFELATRSKMRFPFRGPISVEDLWDLSIVNLDSIYKTLNSKLKQAKEESLLDTKTEQDKQVEMMIEIIKYIVSVKQEEEAAKTKAKENKEQKQKIAAIISAKKDQAMHDMPVEQLEAMLESLNK